MAADYQMKRNDTSPDLTSTLLDSSGTAVNLTGATVRFHMLPKGSTTLKVDAAATVVTPLEGTVSYSWVAADTDTHGTFDAEFEVTFSNGEVQSFPNSDYIEIEILRDLG